MITVSQNGYICFINTVIDCVDMFFMFKVAFLLVQLSLNKYE